MFSMFPDGTTKMYREDDMTLWDQFVVPALVDVEEPVPFGDQ